MQNIVAILNRAKKAKKMTLKQLAEQSGLTQGTVNKIMSGELKSIKPDKLARLAQALDVSPTSLQQAAEQPSSKEFVGMVKIACISPELKVASCAYNVEQIVKSVREAAQKGVEIAVLPELCITGYSCGDLFFQNALRTAAVNGLKRLCEELSDVNVLVAVGLPLPDEQGRLYNVAAVLYRGRVLGVIPKKHLPNYNEFMEKRFFCSYEGDNTTVKLFGEDVPFGNRLVFVNDAHREVRFGVEVCEDVWVANSPSIGHTAAGANAVFNLSASNETVLKASYRKKMIEIQSAKCGVIYAYCSSGPSESTSNTVFSAHNIICENGELLAESQPFAEGYAEACADFDFVENERARLDRSDAPQGYTFVHYSQKLKGEARIYSPTPFVPQDKAELAQTCERALTILAYGLKKRIEHVGASKLVIGISGGSDSTLALMVCVRALKLLSRPATDVLAITMPCFGTGKRSLNNAIALAQAVGATLRQVNISAAVTQHLKDIDHDFSPDTTFENAQARERTQVLMDVANACNGLVVGTGDMSEAALGWSTFNGDQMSMYAAIASVPKTLVKAMLLHCAQNSSAELKRVLQDIANAPVSPELLPTDDNGNVTQLTENVVGPYELHDYFLFMLVRKGFSPSKVYRMACRSFEKYSPETIMGCLKLFVKRFFSQQFKRSCTPDSVRLGSVDLGKYALRMPSDADCAEWLTELSNIQQVTKCECD